MPAASRESAPALDVALSWAAGPGRPDTASAGDVALAAQHAPHLVEVGVRARQDRVRRLQGVRSERGPERPHPVEQADQGRPECLLVALVHGLFQGRVQGVELLGGRIVDLELPLAQDPNDHAPSPAWGCSAAAGRAAPSCACVPPPSIACALPAPISPLRRCSSSSMSCPPRIESSSAWMSSCGVPDMSLSAPEAISSSIAPARACICAVLSCARCTAMPTSPISSEMPDTASPILLCASAAV